MPTRAEVPGLLTMLGLVLVGGAWGILAAEWRYHYGWVRLTRFAKKRILPVGLALTVAGVALMAALHVPDQDGASRAAAAHPVQESRADDDASAAAGHGGLRARAGQTRGRLGR